ncbi:Alpha/Beta hydrolase protein [Dendryphion nanum]|uniref:Alpha/Beta hydrolase protein n=1 Tax=Dendryphion nanum TaxID=256645 RepID=A0A9P9IGU7_9PLEO|nr:Alpha/Beta hydrolase protein [Dendryphion nanum]KAH7119552.1 Alpha/Beta hydrolase protein [Dendryphion nanum]
MLLTLLTTIYSCIHLAQAAPAVLEQRDVSPDVLSRLQLMEQYAAAAYCRENNNSPETQLSCHVGNCPRVDAADTYTALEFQNTPHTDTTGFVAIDNTNQLIVVSFRGTASFLGWIVDFTYNRTPTTICNGCGAHQGFWTAWLSVRDAISNTVRDLVVANPGFNVICTGHSLGGAIASLAAADLRNAGYNATLYSFGAPRFADSVLSEYISNQPGGNYRVTHTNDPVPRVPPSWTGAVHVRPEYYITTSNFQPVNTADIRICLGSLDRGCNAGWLWFDVISHGWYFDNIWLCFPLLDLSPL